MTENLLTDTDGNWVPVSESLVKGRRIVAVAVCTVAFFVLASVTSTVWISTSSVLWTLPSAVLMLIPLGLLGWLWAWAARNQASWGYLEEEEELLVRGGVMFRRVVVVPYGRMQFVDVQAGPIATKLGYASVTLHTASTSTAATIPGVPLAEAHRLRNRLTELGESNDAGL